MKSPDFPRSVATSAQLRPFYLGLLFGFAMFGPATLATWLLGYTSAGGRMLPPFALPRSSDMGFYEPLLALQVRSANRQKRAVLVGSSEFRGAPSVPELMERIAAQSAPGLPAPVTVGFRGSAIWRTVLLLERLHYYGLEPERVAVVANPYYAHARAPALVESASAYFPDRESLELHRCRVPTSVLRAAVPESGSCSGATNVLRQATLFRRQLARTIGVPLTQLLRSGRWAGGEAAMAGYVERETASPSAASFHIPRHGDFVDSVHALARALERHPRVQLIVLVLPLNEAFYRRHGLVAAREEATFRGVLAHLEGRATITVLERQREGRLFADAVHYTAEGRDLLAREIRSAVEALRSAD